MNARWLLIAAMVLLGTVGLLLPLQPPTPRPAKSSQNKENLGGPKPSDRTDNDRPSSSIQPATNDSHSQPKGREEKNESEGQNHDPSYGWLTMAASVVAAIATSIYAYFAARQWQAMRQQADYTREGLALTKQAADAATKSADTATQAVEHMRLEQRAWLGLMLPTVNELVVGQPVRCSIAVKNCGNTPGTIVKEGVAVFVLPRNVDIGRLMLGLVRASQDGPERETVIAPGSTQLFLNKEEDVILNDQMRDRIADGSVMLYLAVFLAYLDVQKLPHTTRGCYFYNVPAKTLYGHTNLNYMD